MDSRIKYRPVAMATATVNGIIPNGHAGNEQQAWVAADDSTARSRSWDAEIHLDETYELPYHGSCPKCHHLHTSYPLTVSKNPTVHLRLFCESCGHPILGIGKTSTQTTLASVESIPQPRSNRNTGASRPSNLQVCVNALPSASLVTSPTSPEQPSPLGQLSTITEANTLAGRSRSTSNLPAPEFNSQDNSRTLSTAISSEVSVRASGRLSSPVAGGHQQPRDQSTPNSKFKYILSQGKRRLLKGSRYIKSFRYRFRGKLPDASPSKQGCSPEPANPTPSPERTTEVRDTRDDDIELESSHRGQHSLPVPTITNERPPLDFSSRQLQSSLPNPSEPPSEIINVEAALEESESHLPDDARSGEAKNNRIRARRREATLKDEAARRPVCQCRPGCPCLGNDGGSDVDSRGPSRDSSSPVPDIPNPPLPNIMTTSGSGSQLSLGRNASLNFVGIGGHLGSAQFFPNRRTSLAEHSNPGADSSQPQPSRFSQDTTVWESSNDSSISLPGRRSSFLAIAMPSYRIGERTVSQSDSLPRHHDFSMDSGPANLPTRERTGRTPNDDISDGSSVNLENLPDPRSVSERPGQSSETMSSSQATYVDGTAEQSGSQEITPRPRSYQSPIERTSNAASEPTPAQILAALQDGVPRQDNEPQ